MQMNLHPRRWHLLTWSAFVLWLLFAVVSNRPHNVTYESFSEFSDDPSNASGTPTANISTTNSSITSSSTVSAPLESSSTGNTATVYSSISTISAAAFRSTILIGWPFTYQEYTATATSRDVTIQTHWFWLLGNFVVICIVQYCVAYSFNQIGQFSVKTIMVGTLLVALLILLGRVIFEAFSFWGIYYYAIALYYAPAIFAMLSGTAKWYVQRRRMTEQSALSDLVSH